MIPEEMTLRDWFAGQALTGLMSSETEGYEYTKPSTACKRAYQLADAMMEARNNER